MECRNAKGLMFVSLFVAVVQMATAGEFPSIELIKDPHFENGFCVIDPNHGARVIAGYLNCNEKIKPSWDLVQWHSLYSLAGSKNVAVESRTKRFADEAKSVTVGAPGSGSSDLILALNSNPEFKGKFRQEGQPWPHLLVEQRILDCPSMADLKEMRFHIEVMLLQSECDRSRGYRQSLHTAQFPFVMTIQKCNKNSPGYGDFAWFIIPLYDSRYRDWQESISQDTADPSKKAICNLGAKACRIKTLHDGRWVTVDVDVLPLLIEGMKEIWIRGYLADSQDLKDYRISSINMGWEVTGLCKASIQIRNVSLKAKTGVNGREEP